MEISKELYDILVEWIRQNIIPIRSINRKYDTSHIRQAFFDDGHDGMEYYLDDETVNKAMLELGFHAANFASDPYLEFNVSNQSPAFRKSRK